MIKWEDYIDHIYIVDYIKTDPQVTYKFNCELLRIGINRNNTDFVTTFMNINTPLYEVLFNKFNKSNTNDKYSYTFDCTIWHYYCMKLAQSKNYKRILILENDGIYYDNLNTIENILYQMEIVFNDGSCDLFLGGSGCIGLNGEKINYDDNYIYQINFKTFFAGTTFNVYNDKAYNYFINHIENFNFNVIDEYHQIYFYSDIKIWISNIPICVQQNWDLTMVDLYKHYDMICPDKKQIEYAYYNANNFIWGDKRNQFKCIYDCLIHFNLENEYKEIYQDCLNHI